MFFQHIIIFSLKGITLESENKDLEIIKTYNLKAILTSHLEKYTDEVNLSNAISRLILKKMFIKNEKFNKEKLLSEIKQIEKLQNEKYDKKSFLIIKVEGDEKLNSDKIFRNGDINFYFDEDLKNAIKNSSKNKIEYIISSIILNIKKNIHLNKISDAIMFKNSKNENIYLFSFSFTGKGYSSRAIKSEETNSINNTFNNISDRDISEKIFELLISSMKEGNDSFNSFMSSWSALEILINQLFKIYEKKLYNNLKNNKQPSLNKFIKRIRNVMKDKYRLLDKFALLNYYFDPLNADDLASLKDIKNKRNKLIHRNPDTDKKLPIDKVQNILIKYINFHINE